MPIEILMPALSPTMTEGNLTKWLKQEGDSVAPGEVIAEIETDKATMEVEAVDEGRIGRILVPEGTEGVAVNRPIALLLEEGEEDGAMDAAHSAPPKHESPILNGAAPQRAEAQIAQVNHAPGNSRIHASPLARRLAKEAGIDLANVTPSGPHGRIVKADLAGAQAAPKAAPKPAAPAPSAAPTVVSAGINARDYADKLGMRYKAVPNSGVRKTIARRLTEAKQTIPHFYLTIDTEIDALLKLRKEINEGAGTRISVNDLVIKASALALRKIPAANASWSDEAILLYDDVDVSVAVATDNGLITPIIRQADTKGLAQISAEMRDLGLRAREGKLKPEEFQGGGFSVSNLGMFGVKHFEAIINPPQGCILAVGAGEQRPVVKDGALAVATVMTCTLSVDHRVVDGAVGAEFLAAFKKFIENPLSMLI